ncbi:hypothetical protein [Methylocella sp.]|uniref:hypothetical protein n=1 Tax=Methylocella sp. TaxID=1978226 RepID=UPI003783928A
MTGAGLDSERRMRAIVVRAARSWRMARDLGAPIQPSLYSTLERDDCGVLAPAFDSMMTLCERCLRRPLCAGCPMARTADESLLGDLVADPDGAEALVYCAADPQPLAGAFVCALRSMRLMLRDTLDAA